MNARNSRTGRRRLGALLIILALPLISAAGTIPAAVAGIAVGWLGCLLAEF